MLRIIKKIRRFISNLISGRFIFITKEEGEKIGELAELIVESLSDERNPSHPKQIYEIAKELKNQTAAKKNRVDLLFYHSLVRELEDEFRFSS